MKYLSSTIKCYERKYKRKGRQYTTTQYTINLRKEEVESQDFKCDEEICILPKPEFKELIETHQKHQKILEENRQLTKQLGQIQADYDKLKNEYRHLEEVYKKREKQISHLENEVERLQNRGIFEIILEKLTKRKAIEKPKKE
ncbi:MAG: hypothetical protein H5T45_05530 [Thermoplasmatales archaeon]|nr:hypothetical protein [Thermoplasmatales archaeon]